MPPSACHWMPNSAAFSAETSAISDSITTCARRTSSLSTIARMFRYSGSGAVMISELVAASAWIIPESGPLAPPPVPPVALLGRPAGAERRLLGRHARPAGGRPSVCDSPLVVACGTNDGSELMMARSNGASLVASALRR